MDYLEGFLIGPVWSDTEYQTRRHRALYFLLALFSVLLYGLCLLSPVWRARLLIIPLLPGLLLLMLLTLLTPLISSFYYRTPALLRPLLLAPYLARYLLALSSLIQLVLPLYQPNVASLTDLVMAAINLRIDRATTSLAFGGSLFGVIAGIVVGGLWLATEILVVLLLVLLVPLLLILFLKLVQRFLDRFVVQLFFGRLRRR